MLVVLLLISSRSSRFGWGDDPFDDFDRHQVDFDRMRHQMDDLQRVRDNLRDIEQILPAENRIEFPREGFPDDARREIERFEEELRRNLPPAAPPPPVLPPQ